MKKADLIGTLAEGRQADILVLGSSPVENIAATKDILYVIRKGRIARAP
jgi:imidazolonepropionase-like amidohydrolase